MSELTDRMLYSADNGECAAKEVMLFNEPNGYFAGSPEPRVDRKDIKFRVGQVIKHRKFGYKGVIIGWDYRTKVWQTFSNTLQFTMVFSLVDLVKWNSVILLSIVPNLLSSSAIFFRIHTFIFDTPFLLSISFSQMIMSAVY